MGACEFTQRAKGKTAKEAFSAAVEHARYEHGHGGYSGTLAEKGTFVLIQDRTVSTEKEAYAEVDRLMQEGDSRIDDKWGPAGCIRVGDTDTFVFFGWASS